MKDELKKSGYRHATRLIEKISEVVDLPSVVKDAIRQEMDYATMDGYRVTMKHIRNGEEDEKSNLPPLDPAISE